MKHTMMPDTKPATRSPNKEKSLMNKMRFAGLGAVILGASLLCGCSSPAPQQDSQISTTVETTLAAPNYQDYQEQLRLLADTQSQWQQEEPGVVYHYAVTDLDWNGRLEILAMSSWGTGAFTYGNIFEVSADGTSLLKCSLPFGDGELPEMICDFVPAAFDPADGTFYYLFRDDLKNGYAEYYQSIQAIRLKSGVISSNTLGRMSLVATDGVPHEEYYKDDQPITPEEYEAIIPAFQAELEGFTANLEWFTLENSIDEATLAESWEIFRSSRN